MSTESEFTFEVLRWLKGTDNPRGYIGVIDRVLKLFINNFLTYLDRVLREEWTSEWER